MILPAGATNVQQHLEPSRAQRVDVERDGLRLAGRELEVGARGARGGSARRDGRVTRRASSSPLLTVTGIPLPLLDVSVTSSGESTVIDGEHGADGVAHARDEGEAARSGLDRYCRDSASRSIRSSRSGSTLGATSIERYVSTRRRVRLQLGDVARGEPAGGAAPSARTAPSGWDRMTNPPACIGASHGARATSRRNALVERRGEHEVLGERERRCPALRPGCSCQIVASSPSRTCAASSGSEAVGPAIRAAP